MDERRKILNWISKFNYWKDHVDYFARAGDGTGQWFLGSVEYKSWIEGGKRFLWCRGDRKSHVLSWLTVFNSWMSAKQFLGSFTSMSITTKVLSSIAFDHLRKKFEGVDDVAVACVYFNWQESRTTTDIIANLLKQLLERNPALSKEIKDHYDQCQEKRETRLHAKDILQLLQLEASKVSRFLIVLDALDECTGGEISWAKILLALEKILNVSLMITGRPVVERIVLSKCKDIVTLEIRGSDDDSRKTIDNELNTTVKIISNAMEDDPTLRSAILDAIVAKARGMY
jgi:hypothetical protein